MSYWANILVQSTWVIFLLKATLVIAAGGLLTAMLANRAAARYRIWSGVFAALAILPIAHFGFTGWQLPIAMKSDQTRAINRIHTASSMVQEEITAFGVGGILASTAGRTGYGKNTKHSPAETSETGVLTEKAPSSALLFSTSSLFWAIWLFGALFLFLRLVLGRIQAHRLFYHSLPLNDDSWSFVVRFVRRRLGMRQHTVVATHPHVPIPLTYGTARPVVMLPPSADEWSMERRCIVLLHEFAHIRRRDDLTRLAARAVTIMYWFHPLSWLAFRKFKMEQEKSCDERVIRSGIRPSDYASHLVELARGVASRGAFKPMAMAGAATLGMARKPKLEGRLSEILNNSPHKETGMKFKIAGMFFMAACGILLMVQPVAKAMDMPPDPVAAVPAAPAPPAKVKAQKKPATPAKAPKEPKAPEGKKEICKKTVVTVTDNGKGKVIIIKDGNKVKKIHVKATDGDKDNKVNCKKIMGVSLVPGESPVYLVKDGDKLKDIRVKVNDGEEDDDTVILLGDDGDKGHNVFVMKEFKKEYKTQMKAAMVELKQAMEMLAQKKKDLAKLNREMAKSMGSMKVNSAAAKAQLKKAMEKLDVKLKAQMEKNEATMKKLEEANRKLAEEMRGRDFKWVERENEAHARHMEKLENLEAKKARRIKVIVKSKEAAEKDRELKLKKIEEELAKKHVGKTMQWVVQVDEDDAEGDHNLKVLPGHGDHLFIKTTGNDKMKIKLKIELESLEKKDKKKIDKALKKFEKDLPKGVNLNSNRDDNVISLDLNVQEGTKLSDADQNKLDNAVETLKNQIRDIKGNKNVDVHEIHIEKKKNRHQ